ncbi:MAG: TIM barrel protein [Balneolaceae bacterium]
MTFRLILVAFIFLFAELFNPIVKPVQAQEHEQLLPDPGVVSYSFRNQFAEDVPGTLDLIRDMGITNIEFSNLFGKTAGQLREMLDERDLICTSYGVGYNDLLNNPEQVIEDANTLGAKHVRVAWIPHDPPFTIEDARKAATDFNRAGRLLKEAGLYFSYHNHGYEFRPHQDGTLFDYIVKNTNPVYVSFEIDLLWVAHPGHDPVSLLNKYPDRFRLMHLKDLKKGVTGNFSGSAPTEWDVRLGTGQVDIPAVLKAAQHTNIEHFYIEDESPDVIERIPEALKYVKSLTD